MAGTSKSLVMVPKEVLEIAHTVDWVRITNEVFKDIENSTKRGSSSSARRLVLSKRSMAS